MKVLGHVSSKLETHCAAKCIPPNALAKIELTRDLTPSCRVVIVRRALEVVEVVTNEAPTLLDSTSWSAKRE